jgi:NADH:ubiquinone oxidoreductase subunit 6 (subunit J)
MSNNNHQNQYTSKGGLEIIAGGNLGLSAIILAQIVITAKPPIHWIFYLSVCFFAISIPLLSLFLLTCLLERSLRPWSISDQHKLIIHLRITHIFFYSGNSFTVAGFAALLFHFNTIIGIVFVILAFVAFLFAIILTRLFITATKHNKALAADS